MTLSDIAHWLSCPVCADPMSVTENSVFCPAKHSFDRARGGYVNMLGKAPPKHADTATMIAARERFLLAGYYATIAKIIESELVNSLSVVEVGAGTGYYLNRALSTSAHGLGIDISVPAAKAITRNGLPAIVADIWQSLPLLDRSIDALCSIFAPTNLSEFSRVLRRNGLFIKVIPTDNHLASLRAKYQLLDIGADKLRRLESDDFTMVDMRYLEYQISLSQSAILDLIQMGPNAFHGRFSSANPISDSFETQVSVQVLVYRRR